MRRQPADETELWRRVVRDVAPLRGRGTSPPDRLHLAHNAGDPGVADLKEREPCHFFEYTRFPAVPRQISSVTRRFGAGRLDDQLLRFHRCVCYFLIGKMNNTFAS